MAQDINCITINGRLVSDLQIHVTSSGFCIGSGTVACNESVKNQASGQWEEETSFFDFKLLGRRAESLGPYLQKGNMISIQGRLKQERWQDRQSNQNRSKILIMVKDIQMVGGSNPGRNEATQGSQAPRNSQPFERYPQRNENGTEERFEDDIPF